MPFSWLLLAKTGVSASEALEGKEGAKKSLGDICRIGINDLNIRE